MAATEQKTKIVTLPLLEGDNAVQEKFVGLNGKSYIIKRGEPVEVPIGVYNILELEREAVNAAIRAKQNLAIKTPEKA
jgi:hypothetical protein